MVNRYRVDHAVLHRDWPPGEKDVVLAAHYDMLYDTTIDTKVHERLVNAEHDRFVVAEKRIAALEAENAKMRAEYPYLAECLRLQARVAVLGVALAQIVEGIEGHETDARSLAIAEAALAPPTGEG